MTAPRLIRYVEECDSWDDRDEADEYDRITHGITRGPLPADPGSSWHRPEDEDLEPDADAEPDDEGV